MEREVFIQRKRCGRCIMASFESFKGATGFFVSNTKQIVQILMNDDTSDRLFQACWKDAVCDGAISQSEHLTVDMDGQILDYCMVDADVLETYASVKVNNERSSFYIHGR